MWDNLLRNKLYLLVLAGVGLLVLTAMGGGLFNQTGLWFDHWQHKAFRGLCHQDPQRAFWLNGTPMAVCTRCFGIYASFLTAWLILPLGIEQLQQMEKFKLQLLVGAISLNLIDFFGNLIGIWQNTGVSRLILGSLLGLTVALIIGYTLIEETKTNIRGIHYGTNTSGQ